MGENKSVIPLALSSEEFRENQEKTKNEVKLKKLFFPYLLRTFLPLPATHIFLKEVKEKSSDRIHVLYHKRDAFTSLSFSLLFLLFLRHQAVELFAFHVLLVVQLEHVDNISSTKQHQRLVILIIVVVFSQNNRLEVVLLLLLLLQIPLC